MPSNTTQPQINKPESPDREFQGNEQVQPGRPQRAGNQQQQSGRPQDDRHHSQQRPDAIGQGGEGSGFDLGALDRDDHKNKRDEGDEKSCCSGDGEKTREMATKPGKQPRQS